MTQDAPTTEDTFKSLAHRQSAPASSVGIGGVDHVGIPTRDPLVSGAFVEQILGGVEFITAGYSEEDIKLGRPRHIFYKVGAVLLEVAEQNDGEGYPATDTRNDQPHFAFGTTAAGLLEFADHLRGHKIPFNGPRLHRGMSAVSVYFRDPDGNNLEVTTWEPVPEGCATPMGGPYGFVPWTELAHDWKPAR